LAEIFIFSPIVSQPLLISISSSKSSKLQTYVRPQEDTTLYFLPRLNSWDWISPCQICMICVYSLLFSPKFHHHQIVLIIKCCCQEWSDIMYTWIPFPDCGVSHL
jgi:hypothetical protein